MTPRESILDLQQRMQQSIIGQAQVVERLLLTLLCNGNVLVEGTITSTTTNELLATANELVQTEFALDSEFEQTLTFYQTVKDYLRGEIKGSHKRFPFSVHSPVPASYFT